MWRRQTKQARGVYALPLPFCSASVPRSSIALFENASSLYANKTVIASNFWYVPSLERKYRFGHAYSGGNKKEGRTSKSTNDGTKILRDILKGKEPQITDKNKSTPVDTNIKTRNEKSKDDSKEKTKRRAKQEELEEKRSKRKDERKLKEKEKLNAKLKQKEREQNWRNWMHRQSGDISLVYGDWTDPFVVINKPSGKYFLLIVSPNDAIGIPVRDEEGTDGGGDSVFKRIRQKFVELKIETPSAWSTKDFEEGEEEFTDLPTEDVNPLRESELKNEGIVEFPHRLDKWTSGLLVVSFNKSVTQKLQHSLQRGWWRKRYRILAQIPPCVLEKLRTGDRVAMTDRPPLYNGQYCCMSSPVLEGCLVDWSQTEFLEKGVLESRIGKRLRENNDFVPSVLESLPSEAKVCAFCSAHPDVFKTKRRHPFVVRHLLYRSIPAVRGLHDSGRRSITEFEFKGLNTDIGLALYEATLVTGRTHQLRIHFADAGFPVNADPYYNPFFVSYLNGREGAVKDNTFFKKDFLDMGLHSYELEFPHPYRKESIKLELPIPSHWKPMEKINTK